MYIVAIQEWSHYGLGTSNTVLGIFLKELKRILKMPSLAYLVYWRRFEVDVRPSRLAEFHFLKVMSNVDISQSSSIINIHAHIL